MKPFYTLVFRSSANVWVALCLENGLVGQGPTKDVASQKLIEAIQSFDQVAEAEVDVYQAPLSIRELHEFLALDELQPESLSYELKAVYA